MGKKISHYDGFSGSSDYFVIGHIEIKDTYIVCRSAQGVGFGVYIPNNIIDELIAKGQYEHKTSIAHCDVSERWKIIQ